MGTSRWVAAGDLQIIVLLDGVLGMEMSVSTLVHAPRSKVFALALDVERWSAIISAIEKVEILTPGSVGVGTLIRETRKMFGQSASEDMTFTEIIPDERFVLTAHSHGTAYRTEHVFEDVDGGTKVTMNFEGKPTTWTAWLLMPIGLLMMRSMRNMIAQDLKEIKAAAEQTG